LATEPQDEWIARLTQLFREHPAWRDAARRIRAGATSNVFFTHCPGEAWRLEVSEGGGAELLPGASDDPDLVFRFSPEAIERLESVEGGIGDFAVALFQAILDEDVSLRIAAGFPRLLRRGYVKLLRAAGRPVVAFGVAHGVSNVGALRRLVEELRDRSPADWEQ
jgi:hypothetical protein